MVSPEFAANVMINWRVRMAESMAEEGKRNIESEVIRIEMEGRRYNVPLRYTYGQAIEKRGYWPTTKPERVKVGALTLSVLLPDLKPYYPEDDARWKVRGHGDRMEVTIAKSDAPGWFNRLKDRYLNGKDKFASRMLDAHGLIRFSVRGMEDIYFPADSSLELTLSCSPEPESSDPKNFFSPSCRVKSNYKNGIALSYTYGIKYLPHWREINTTLKAMFDRFEQAANTKSTGQEK